MKRYLFILIALTQISVAFPSFSVAFLPPGAPQGSLRDTANPHNMSSGSDAGSVKAKLPTAGGTDQICVFCHTPHAATPESALWGRPGPDGLNNGGTLPIYALPLGIKTNPGLTGYNSALNYPNGASRMCLSCHDGVTSIGVLLGNQSIAMETNSETITTVSAIINLETSHPISFNYDPGVLALLASLGKTAYQLPDVSITPLDGSSRMQCTTCHDPHVDTRDEAGYAGLPFWRHTGNPTDNSAYDDVCDSCHTGRGATIDPLPATHIP